MTFIILIGTFNEGLVYLSFKINQDYISKYLCVEKDISESTCHGKCHLTKTIIDNHEQNEDSKKTPLIEKQQSTFYLIFDREKYVDSHLIFFKKKILNASLQVVGNNYTFGIFHPPKV